MPGLWQEGRSCIRREKAEALNAWGKRLTAIFEGRAAADNVIPLRA
jgi:hypothetical protein